MSAVLLSDVLEELARVCVRHTRGDVLELARLLERRPHRVMVSEPLRAALLDVPEGGDLGSCRYRLRVLCGSYRHPINLLAGSVPLLVLDTWYRPTRHLHLTVQLPDPRVPHKMRIQVVPVPLFICATTQLLQVLDVLGVPLPRRERAELLGYAEPRNWRKEPLGALLLVLVARSPVPLDLCNLIAHYGRQEHRIVYVGTDS